MGALGVPERARKGLMNTELPRRRRRRRDILVQSLVVSSAALVLVVASAGSAAARVIGSAGAISPAPGTTFPPTAIATAVSQLFDPWASPDLVSPPITPHPARYGLSATELLRQQTFALAHLRPR